MEYKKKILLLGDSSVGKTSMIRRFVFDKFDDSYISTIGSKTTVKVLKFKIGHKNIELTLIIWDVMGRVGYTGAHARMFKGADGSLLITDLTRKETLDSLERYWIPLLFGVVENVPLIFISNKSDLLDDKAYDSKDMEKIASKYNIGIKDTLPSNLSTTYTTSAKTGENVEHVFESIGRLLLTKKRPRDQIKELYTNLLAGGMDRQTHGSTLIGATDAIIVDFCKGFKDEKLAMLLLRQEIIRSGLDINKPSKVSLFKLVEFLEEVESEYNDEKKVANNKKKRISIIRARKNS